MRDTAVCESPTSAAIERVDQWVASFGVLSRVATMTSSTCSSLIVRGRPGRGSSSRPSSRSAAKRERHRAAMPREIPRRSAISVLFSPSAAANTIRERWARAWALVRRRAQASSCARSSASSITSTGIGIGMPTAYKLLRN